MESATYKPKIYKFVFTIPFILLYVFVHPNQHEIWFYVVSGIISCGLLYKLWRDKPNWEKQHEDVEYRYDKLIQDCKDWMQTFEENGKREKYRRYNRLLQYIRERKQRELNHIL